MSGGRVMAPGVGIEPTTCGLTDHRNLSEARAQEAWMGTVPRARPSRRPRRLSTGRAEPGLFRTGRNSDHNGVADSG
jgi:hypothetical protein